MHFRFHIQLHYKQASRPESQALFARVTGAEMPACSVATSALISLHPKGSIEAVFGPSNFFF